LETPEHEKKQVNKSAQRTLETIFEKPIRSDVPWREVEKLFDALGAEILEGRGSRIRVALGNRRAVFHRPHPQKEIDKGALRSVQRFLREAGFEP